MALWSMGRTVPSQGTELGSNPSKVTMNKKKCECCKAIYATGKSYGDFWQEYEFFESGLEVKGLCEFCNPKSKWFVEKKCHIGRLRE